MLKYLVNILSYLIQISGIQKNVISNSIHPNSGRAEGSWPETHHIFGFYIVKSTKQNVELIWKCQGSIGSTMEVMELTRKYRK